MPVMLFGPIGAGGTVMESCAGPVETGAGSCIAEGSFPSRPSTVGETELDGFAVEESSLRIEARHLGL